METTKQSPEQELDYYIDALNQEHHPQESKQEDMAELQAIARKLKTLRPLPEPSKEFSQKLYEQLKKKTKVQHKYLPWTALAACFLALILLISPWPHTNKDIVLAMEQSVKQLHSYHGILEKISTNAAGQQQVSQRTEIWSEGKQYAVRSEDGTLSVNNGTQRWSVVPSKHEVLLLPVYLDPHDFDLQKEAARVMQYPHKVVGEDSIASRRAIRIEIDPPGGLAYYLWIDPETNLPLQLQTAMQKAIQTTYTYLTLQPNTKIPASLFSYDPPQGYKLNNQNPDKLMTGLEQAQTVSGLTPLQPSAKPLRIFASPNHIVFDFEDTIVSEAKATAPLLINPLAATGQAAEGPLEILPNSLRWQQGGLEIYVQGVKNEELAKQIANKIVIPQTNQVFANQPSVKATIDLDVVKRNQQQVDAGSSPWQLDPVQVAYTFAVTQISPGGITDKPPIEYSSLKVSSNNGTEAVITIDKGPLKTVYLKRLIRQDQSGIWTVIGYDRR